MKVIAIVPIKHNSSRVPGKNYRLLNGKPLYHYIINTLSDSMSVDEIIVDTDSPIIKEGLKHFFPHVKIYDRPANLHGDNMSTNVLLCNVVDDMKLDGDIYLHTHTTNPLLKVTTIENCIKTYLDNAGIHDSLFTVKQFNTRFYKNNFEPMNHDPENLIPTQDLDPIYEENSCLYVVPIETIKRCKRRIGNNPYLYVMSDIESQDIDWEDDFKTTDALIRYKKINNNDKVVLITGCNGGIGSSLTKKYKTEGWLTFGIDIVEPTLEQLIYLDKYENVDLVKDDAPIIILNHIKNSFDRVDCVVNNAAIQINKSFNDLTIDDWTNTMNCNLRIVLFLGQQLHHYLKEVSGNIINISSVHAFQTSTNIAAYATSKGAMTSLTRAMGLEYAPDNIRVNCILPGAIDTDMLRDGLTRGHTLGTDSNTVLNNFMNKHVQKRIGKPTEIAELVYFLSDNDKAGFFVGQSVTMDGGVTIRLSTE
jgi:glucose 1-dehydrogenase